MSPAAFSHFLRLLCTGCTTRAGCTADVFNPWTDRDARYDGTLNGPEARRERLRAHLSVSPALVLIGEASGYQGCHVSGIPFTSERLLMAAAVPRVSCEGQRLSTRPIPWSEPSATVVWGALHALGIAATTILWNAFPWHPHRAGNLQSNRTPTRLERAAGLTALAALLHATRGARVLAVGRHAQFALEEIGTGGGRGGGNLAGSPVGALAGNRTGTDSGSMSGEAPVTVLRHPSMGGARLFCEGLRDAVAGRKAAASRRGRPAGVPPTVPGLRGRRRDRH